MKSDPFTAPKALGRLVFSERNFRMIDRAAAKTGQLLYPVIVGFKIFVADGPRLAVAVFKSRAEISATHAH
ncbi:hypothetical protein D3C83_148820 [compost metagenome]